MLHRISDDVVALVRHDAVVRRPRGNTPGLQYIVQNCGLRRVRVCMDFSQSEHVQLVFPDAHDGEDARDGLVVTADVNPLQRRHVCFVARQDGAKAFVRVDYTLVESVIVDEEEMTRAREQCEQEVQTAIQRSLGTFGGIYEELEEVFVTSALADTRVTWCADINRLSRKRGIRFVDPLFPPSAETLWGKHQVDQIDTVARNIFWRHVSEVVDEAWCFVDSMLRVEQEMPRLECILGQESWACAMDLLFEFAPPLLRQWFGKSQGKALKLSDKLHDISVVSVNLCVQGIQWVQVVIDLFVPILPVPAIDTRFNDCALMTTLQGSCSFYHILLHKAYAKLVGGYSCAATKCTQEILRTLGVDIFEIALGSDMSSSDQKKELEAYLFDHFRTKTETTARIIVVSFDEIDNHHCSFLLSGVHLPEDHSNISSSHFRFRDPSGKLSQLAAAKLGEHFDAHTGNMCSFTSEGFFRLVPRVFEVSLFLQKPILRRRIVSVINNAQTSLKVAVSCGQLHKVTIEGLARSMLDCSQDDYARVTLEVDRVDDENRYHRVKLEKLNNPVSVNCSGRFSWVAVPGEFIISVHADSEGEAFIRLSSSDTAANLDLLFRCLDQDMNGILDLDELLTFLRLHDDYPSADEHDAESCVSAFIRKWASTCDVDGRGGITKSDFYDIYRAFSRLDDNESRATLIWRDLLLVLGIEVNQDPANEISARLVELVCSIKTDRKSCDFFTAVLT